MKWHIKIYIAPSVQEEPEEFDVSDLARFNAEIIEREIPLTFVREIRITKVSRPE